jgi:16S rRNA (cytidine1402-2'-O)-methyltransferase
MPLISPILWVVATPLGNPGDLGPRARAILDQADLILAEDTRRAGLFFQRHGIAPRGRLLSFFEHNEQKRVPEALRTLEQGHSIALISDAGTPLIGDPGYRLVRACREAGFPVSPVPGPCAPVSALCASGLPPCPFAFLGFLPRQAGHKKRLFSIWADVPTTLIFFERNSRLNSSLDIAARVLGSREVCLARELTKEHEQFSVGRLEDHLRLDWDPRGEMTVVIGPPEQQARTPQAEVDRMLLEDGREGAPREIAARVAAQVAGWSSKELYGRILANSERHSSADPT